MVYLGEQEVIAAINESEDSVFINYNFESPEPIPEMEAEIQELITVRTSTSSESSGRPAPLTPRTPGPVVRVNPNIQETETVQHIPNGGRQSAFLHGDESDIPYESDLNNYYLPQIFTTTGAPINTGNTNRIGSHHRKVVNPTGPPPPLQTSNLK